MPKGQHRSDFKAITAILGLFLASQVLPAVFASIFYVGSGETADPIAITIYSSIICAIIASWAVYRIDKKYRSDDQQEADGQSLGPILAWSILGFFLLLIGQNLATWIEIQFLNQPLDSQNTNLLLELIQAYPLYTVYVCLLGPFLEEYVFRKTIYASLAPHTGKIGAAIISALIFAFMHGDGHILVYSATAFVLTYIYDRSGSIWSPILAHVFLNSLVVFSNLYF